MSDRDPVVFIGLYDSDADPDVVAALGAAKLDELIAKADSDDERRRLIAEQQRLFNKIPGFGAVRLN